MANIILEPIKPGDDREADKLFAEMEAERPTIAFVTSLDDDVSAKRLAAIFGSKARFYENLDDLSRYGNEQVLLSFSTSMIIPEEIFSRFRGGAYNLHAASPEYPGRDPHHWAIYDGATRYGATLHVMTKRVDGGPIIDTEMFDVPSDCTPANLMDLANDAAYRILKRNAAKFIAGVQMAPISTAKWSGTKRSRKDFLAMCEISSDISEEEFKRRFRAFDGGDYDNLFLTVHGKTFRIDKRGQG